MPRVTTVDMENVCRQLEVAMFILTCKKVKPSLISPYLPQLYEIVEH
jgi:hypothetical protein